MPPEFAVLLNYSLINGKVTLAKKAKKTAGGRRKRTAKQQTACLTNPCAPKLAAHSRPSLSGRPDSPAGRPAWRTKRGKYGQGDGLRAGLNSQAGF
ncbi:hypothetical protein A6M21_02610 [Desulfotomaculum copahuensis]|uniref:Uncharacterized protein n=1 Tax=Desulfotomaculum copahuensis TaxID=1838280 RepID=A0A1B7LJH8_9FIRM|nr:hypothetical protein A6M21_02610 [Desulfotomaculum copahuensis]